MDFSSNKYENFDKVNKKISNNWKDAGKALRVALRRDDYFKVEEALKPFIVSSKNSNELDYLRHIIQKEVCKMVSAHEFWRIEEYKQWRDRSTFVKKHVGTQNQLFEKAEDFLDLNRKNEHLETLMSLFFDSITQRLPGESLFFSNMSKFEGVSADECFEKFKEGLEVLHSIGLNCKIAPGFVPGEKMKLWKDERFGDYFEANVGPAFPLVSSNKEEQEYYELRPDFSKQACYSSLNSVTLANKLRLGFRFDAINAKPESLSDAIYMCNIFSNYDKKGWDNAWQILKEHDEKNNDCSRAMILALQFSHKKIHELASSLKSNSVSSDGIATFLSVTYRVNLINMSDKEIRLNRLKEKWDGFMEPSAFLVKKMHEDGLDQLLFPVVCENKAQFKAQLSASPALLSIFPPLFLEEKNHNPYLQLIFEGLTEMDLKTKMGVSLQKELAPSKPLVARF